MNERDRELALKAEIEDGLDLNTWEASDDEMQKFADLIRADEREACAALDFRKEIGLTSDQDSEVSQLILLRGNE